ncbi:MAG: acyl-CoA dehydratase activase [Candidatus Electrothrix aestuarii]|uniref:Acyl-CoA dehydratase activase n=1 Tax=Candidatus Electrothrix aestuarii TaxID=3062594 RepID=A0AAU8LQ78_9BACT|nr:acyl-CoA dehydratase activase [Candidatus Electrothrix aestuarii]
MKSLGICAGASSISLAGLEQNSTEKKLLFTQSRAHDGNPRKVLREMLEQIEDLQEYSIAVTGRKFRNMLNFSGIAEPEAVELAAAYLLPPDHPYRVVISAGGETTMVYHLDEDGRVNEIHTGNKCASGTGEFFLQQLGRMSVTLDEAGEMKLPEKPYKVSGRCSVFCKSDCTHALNKGIPKDQVVAGLSRMMSGKVMELLKKLPKDAVMLVGGCVGNQAMVHYLQEAIPDLYIPTEAAAFEALGAALWAMENEVRPFTSLNAIFTDQRAGLATLPPLSECQHLVDYKHQERGVAVEGDKVILGLDVGSTTTKGVLMRRSDKAIVAAEYLRTNGDPIGASKNVYQSLADQVKVPISIEGLGVTGSGRQIAGLHALTDGVINEIVAHATAAVHFDPEVDTIFEIGGQDAKYTYITNGVPSDYAMNEACSAGTGSFLEEAAKESLGLAVTEIGNTAFRATAPPNFSDQCAAFIGSDIKRSVQENVPLKDIVAGLVYSIGMNYNNRVKGNRPVGKKVFVQGGVCYNKAVPAAMAGLTGKHVVVPSEAGLMGAFGVALEVERRMEQGLLTAQEYDLQELIAREVEYGEPFKCGGGKDCDRGCEISRIKIKDKVYPFGGICNRYDNLIHNRKVRTEDLNLVIKREQRVFRDLAPADPTDTRPTVGMNRSFLLNTYFPFFNAFFAELGFRLTLPSKEDPKGMDQQGAAFCYPVEIAHNYAATLLTEKPDYIFMPHLRGLDMGEPDMTSCTCVLVQGEPYYLRTAFPGLTPAGRVISQVIDFSKGNTADTEAFEELIRKLGVDTNTVDAALQAADTAQKTFTQDIRAMGKEALAALEADPEKFGTVVFGRPYNAFASVANKGIPAKFASRGIAVIPFDMLPYWEEKLSDDENMYWAMGQIILKGARFVERHPQLFGTYITNFSCGPDSFLVSFFRDVMGRKPSLTLELDSHTADAGLETRIEAFLDIIRYYREIQKKATSALVSDRLFRAATLEEKDGVAGVRTSDAQWVPLSDPKVRLLIPAMSRYCTPLLAAAFGRIGIRTEILESANEDVLKLGRGNASCKECLPLQTTLGGLLHRIKEREDNEILIYYMASSDGPCRLGQYHVYTKRVLERQKIRNVAMLTPTSMNGYCNLGDNFLRAAWRAIIIGDLFDEMWSTVLAGAKDREAGLQVFHEEFEAVRKVIHRRWPIIASQLSKSAARLKQIELKMPYEQIPKISLIGEMYVRHDPLSLQNIMEKLADRGFIVRTAMISEYIKFIDWLIKHDIEGERTKGFAIREQVKRYFNHAIRKRLGPSGLFFYDGNAPIEPVMEAGSKYVSPYLTVETIVTVGSAMHEILHPSCGIISIGPFGCMPSRVAEAVLNEKFTTTEKLAQLNGEESRWRPILEKERKLPFICIETDGNPFPQLIEARMEAFCLQAERLNEQMLACR